MFVMKDNKVGPAHLKIASSPSYTLAELEQLVREWADDIRLSTVDRLIVGQLLIWLAKREQGEVSG